MTPHPAGHGGKAPDTERRAAPQASTRAHLRGPWVYAPASEEGSAVVSPPTDDDSVKVWWTAIIDCADDDVANDIARLIAAAPDLLAALKLLLREVELSGNADAKDYGWPAAVSATRAAINRATGDATDQPVTEAEGR